jgi:superoxide dismutase, Fe-Mn family
MTFTLPPLPFAKSALEPYISSETLEYHYGKHHQTYVDNLNKLIVGTEFASMQLVDIIKKAKGGIFNNAAQVWNHTFYWNCLTNNYKAPSSTFLKALEKHFGSLSGFQEQFTKAALAHFGSGWAWLVKNNDGALEILTTSNAENPMTSGKTPLLVCDVWEHAYYIDYRNARAKYLEAFWKIVNFEFVESTMENA